MIVFYQWLFAHLLGDFVFQTKKMVLNKRRLKEKSWILYLHCLLHAGLIYIFSPDKSIWLIPFIVFITHYCIDLWKLNRKNSGLYFIIDQVLHILVLVVLWMVFYQPESLLKNEFTAILSNKSAWIIGAGYIIIIYPLSFLLGYATAKWREQLDTDLSRSSVSLGEAGKWIGIFERILVFTFVITGHYEGIGFLIAAKSILRYSDSKGNQVRKESEYILIGTLMSFASSIMVGLIAQMLLHK
ncbi:MAG: DUF3307 domain-containing protein [Bacteroidetes bacterium]|nr:DUF3307 domain-containing protein [Bacteroidota bacterium]